MLAKHAETERDVAKAAEAARRLERVRPLLPRDTDVLDGLAVARALEGNVTAAVAHWQTILSVRPHHKETMHSLFLIAEQQGNLRQASIYGERLLAVWPWDDQTVFRMASISLRLGRKSEAESYGQRAMELNPGQVEYWRWFTDNIYFGSPAKLLEVRDWLQRRGE